MTALKIYLGLMYATIALLVKDILNTVIKA